MGVQLSDYNIKSDNDKYTSEMISGIIWYNLLHDKGIPSTLTWYNILDWTHLSKKTSPT